MSRSQRAEALGEASVPTLLMCLAQITRDPRWLDDPFRPKRDISIFAERSGGLSEPAQQVVCEAIGEVLDELADGRRTLPPLPTADELSKMMSACVGEHVPREYTGMAMEEMGFATREGLLPALIIMILPFGILWVLVKQKFFSRAHPGGLIANYRPKHLLQLLPVFL